jgi:hypothetical protein
MPAALPNLSAGLASCFRLQHMCFISMMGFLGESHWVTLKMVGTETLAQHAAMHTPPSHPAKQVSGGRSVASKCSKSKLHEWCQ